MIRPGPAPEHPIFPQHVARFEFRQGFCLIVEQREIDLVQVQQVVERIDNEVGFLEIIDPIAHPDDAQQVEPQSVGRRVVKRELRFGKGRDDVPP